MFGSRDARARLVEAGKWVALNALLESILASKSLHVVIAHGERHLCGEFVAYAMEGSFSQFGELELLALGLESRKSDE